MNYYEQFYDDLEFCDPEDDRYGRDPYFRDDPRTHNDPYYRDEPYYREEPYYQDNSYYDDRGHYGDRESDQYYHSHDRNRHGPYDSGWREGQSRPRGRGRGHETPRGRGRGHESGEDRSSRGFNRGRGRGNQRGGFKAMNFVKATTSSNQQQTGEKKDGANSSGSDQIRFDYRGYQDQPLETEVEEEQALRAYKCQLGFGYGYGPRSDLIEGDQPEWLIGQEESATPAAPETEDPVVAPALPTVEAEVANKPEPNPIVKTAMIQPAFNFVKANAEFHSIDVAFHETEKEIKPAVGSLSVNYGNKRVGLGFGVSLSKGAPNDDISSKFHAGLKDGCNTQMDARYKNLQNMIKAKTLPNKNAIEIIHMAVDKLKMSIGDEISPSGYTSTGQPMFGCKLEIDGVSVGHGQATAKKAAKHEAYQNALKLFSNPSLTVKEVSQGVLELKEKESEFKAPVPIAPSGFVGTGQKPSYVPSQKSQPGQVAQSVTQSTSSMTKLTPGVASQASQNAYTKPKIVFHQPSHPLNNKPLEFKNAESESAQTGLQIDKAAVSKPEALALKLLNFVKESSQSENQSDISYSSYSDNSLTENSSSSQRANETQNKGVKRPGQFHNQKGDKLKFQRKGGSVQNHIEDLSQFVIIDNSTIEPSATDLSILHSSANFNRVILKLEYEGVGDGFRCSLIISDIIVSISQGSTKEESKLKAACDSLNYLRDCCYTIKIKQAVDSDDGSLSKEQLLSDIQKAGESGVGGVIPDSNIGNMLLRKMGWGGGGCGKDGKGIAEPVKAEMIIGREGLGLSAKKGIGKNFHQKVTKMLEDYIRSDDQKDLHFSSELTKEERAIIHKIGQKLGLKTQSKGKDANRYLVVSRKRSALELLTHVKDCGGSTSKYELIPPGDSDIDVFKREDISHGHCKQ